MGISKTIVTCFLLVLFTVLLSNQNILVSGEKTSFDHCDTLCTDYYGWHECLTDCTIEGYVSGLCASPSPNQPKRCCCQKHPLIIGD
ncbi:unnamed protein product [Arabidopsis halleri]